MRKETQFVLDRYSDMFSSCISEYFEALWKDEKTAIHIEIYPPIDSKRHQATIQKGREGEP